MTSPVLKALYDALSVVEALRVSCGGSESLEEAEKVLRLLIDAARRGEKPSRTGIENIIQLLLDARDELEELGCLEAYRLEDAIAALESIEPLLE